LPTEAEWEYACRAGTKTPFYFGNSLCSTQANFHGIHPSGKAAKGPWLQRTCEVGSYPPNAFGLFDMHGNVYEWCHDWYAEDYYASSPRRDPEGPSPQDCFRVMRGGSWLYSGVDCRSVNRVEHPQAARGPHLGFRVAQVPSDQG
jgi:formylglycine-generating enzyme required for sulfatase activity